MSNEWRRVAAALARQDRRRAYASLALGVDSGLTAAKQSRAVADLEAVGLVVDGAIDDEFFPRLLTENAPLVRTGVERWLVDGRIAQYPARPVDRQELLHWVGDRLPDADLDEGSVNELLAAFVDDVATLRRYLVDAGLVSRSPDGTSYRREA